jgi:lipopolysaccharide transport system permease protein
MKETIYSPESEIRSFGAIFSGIFRGLKDGMPLGKRLFVRNIKAMYRQSLLGLLWAFIPPLLTSVIWIMLNNHKVLAVGDTDMPYPIYVLVGTMLWQILVDAIQLPLKTVALSKKILIKLNFPRESLIIAGLYEVLFNAAIKIFFLGVILVVFGVQPTSMIAMAPVAILGLIMLGLSIGVLLTPIGLLYQDIQRAIQFGMQFLMYLTPVIYTIPKEGLLKTINEINPVTPLIINARNWLTIGDVYQMDMFWFVQGGVLLVFIFALVIYRLSMPHIIERMGS